MMGKIIKYILNFINLTLFLCIINTSLFSQNKTALVLSGGGARGFAHIGVLKALEEVGWYPDLIVGTSMGAIIGTMYSCGKTPDEIANYIKDTKWQRLLTKKNYREVESVSQKRIEIPAIFALRIDKDFKVFYPKYLLSTQGISDRLFPITLAPEFYAKSNFDSLAIPIRIVATNIKSGKSIVFKKGNIARLLSGSSAYPIVLSPVKIDSMLLVDGGISNNVPCDIAINEGADFIVAVDMSSRISNIEDQLSTAAYMDQTINALSYYSDIRNLHLADVLIRPDVEQIYSGDFDSVDVLIESGYQATKNKLDIILQNKNNKNKPSNFYNTCMTNLDSMIIKDIVFNNTGNTRKHVLKREIELKKNKYWDMKKARKSVKNLFSTGLYSNVDIGLEQVSDDSLDIIFDIVQKPNGVISIGLNYQSEKNVSAMVSAKYMNLFGSGIINNFSSLLSDYHKKINLDIVAPKIFETILTNSLSLYLDNEKFPLYEKTEKISSNMVRRYGFNANFGVQIKRVGLTTIGVKFETVDVLENTKVIPNINAEKYNVARMIGRIIIDNTDDFDLPTKGHKNDIFYEQSLDANELEPFSKFSAITSNYKSFGDYTFSLNFQFGYLTSAKSKFEQFYFGGQNSFPGLHYKEKSGNLILILGSGMRAPITSDLFFHINTYFGNAWNIPSDFNWMDLKLGIKAGFFVPTPIGPISADFGTDIEGRNMFYFSVGHRF